MKFCDKLAKIRKQNNITQEQLADKLGISRQAVSKWELGISIPDMEKILELCNILNCNLEDLLDDGIIKENKNVNTKNTFFNYFQDFLNYITKIYNMFYSMKFIQKVKCLLEMIFVFLILFGSLTLIYEVINNLIINNIFNIPILGNYLYMFFNNIFLVFEIIIGLIIFFHIFKIRYLDYYITIEDKTIKEKSIEKEIKDEKVKNEYKEKPIKEKIIIRDPKHSTFSFFEFLSKILLFIIKIFDFFILLILLIIFIFILILFIFLLWHLKYGFIFLYLTTLILGIIFIIYIFIELFFNFIISKKQNFKRIFILGIIGFILLSFGISSSIVSFLNFKDDYKMNYQTEMFELEIDDFLILYDDNYFNMNTEYVYDDSLNNIKIEVKYPENMNIYLNNYSEFQYMIYLFNFNPNLFKTYKLVLNLLKNEKTINYDNIEKYNITIYISNNNYKRLIDNKERYNTLMDNIYME